ncbi:hypothetical protein VTK26DRAFT_2487 [Humicola hyalothermophila]
MALEQPFGGLAPSSLPCLGIDAKILQKDAAAVTVTGTVPSSDSRPECWGFLDTSVGSYAMIDRIMTP